MPGRGVAQLPMIVGDYVETVRQHLPDLEIRSVKSVTSGWDFFVLEVNRDLLFRFPRDRAVKARLDIEVELLTELAPASSRPGSGVQV